MVYMVTQVFNTYVGNKEFTVRTDHASLQYRHSMKEKAPAAMRRWISFLDHFKIKVVHRAGIKHANADALSHINMKTTGCKYPTCQDPSYKAIAEAKLAMVNIFYTGGVEPPGLWDGTLSSTN